MARPSEDLDIKRILDTCRTSLTSVNLPIFRMEDLSICGYELLIRGPGTLRNPETLFLTSASSGMLCEMDRASLAVSAAASRHIPQGMRVHVNLFAETILRADMNELIEEIQSTPTITCIEIVEMSIVPEPEELALRAGRLQKAGIELAVDDVGFGASSVESLVMLEPSIVKLDRRFVTGAWANKELARRCKRLLLMVRALGCQVIAEGVDSGNDREFLAEFGVEMGQGLLSGPLPV